MSELGKKKIKVCFAASSGGHFEQMMALKPLMLSYDSFILTEETGYSAKTPVRKHTVFQVNRIERLFPLKFVAVCFKSLWVFAKERPDVVISTGVLSTIPICMICKIFRKKLIYIESFAKTTSGTQTGLLLRKYADRFYVQWESMLNIYPEAVFVGGIY